MCGITAFTGQTSALPFLLQGLEKLEYRGYDSAGVTLVDSQSLNTYKVKGRLSDLKEELKHQEHHQSTGIGHTRWATHGIPSQLNSHPHTNRSNTISIVHNGIIENHQAIRNYLKEVGYPFVSQTDSECIVHLIDYYYEGDLLEATRHALKYLQGSFALCVVSLDHPDQVIVAKKESPMILGQNDQASFCASDIPAILEYTKDVVVLGDDQLAVLKPGSFEIMDFDGTLVELKKQHVPYDIAAAQKGGYDTFMEKEIHEQPYVIHETLRMYMDHTQIKIDELDKMDWHFEDFNRVYFIGCGTAYHACLYAQYLFDKWLNIPSFCMPASEFRYGDPKLDKKSLCILVSQSGETADTLAALKMAKEKGSKSIAITNVLGSTISRLADVTLYTCAGPEIAVASTKAYTTQLVLLCVLMIQLAQKMNCSILDVDSLLQDLQNMDMHVEKILSQKELIKDFSSLLKNKKDAYFIGRQLDYVSVLEGALKLKEISYIHADAYYAGELKHGPIALIEKGSVVIALAMQENVAEKTLSNIEETMARGAHVILITSMQKVSSDYDHVFKIDNIHPYLSLIPVTIVLQLIAYYAALQNECDVDKPRNLAKSVTVE